MNSVCATAGIIEENSLGRQHSLIPKGKGMVDSIALVLL